MKRMEDLMDSICTLDGNYVRNGTYISPRNMDVFISEISEDIELCDLLICPFLINMEDGGLYDLLYYEFKIQLSTRSTACYEEYPQENILPKEITDNIHPQIYIPMGDHASFKSALFSYMRAMEKMNFADEKIYLSSISASHASSWQLFFQLC